MNPELELYASLLNISNLDIEKVEIEKNVFHIYCKIVSSDAKTCPSCLNKVAKKTPKYYREVQDLSISGRKVILHLLVHQYLCECGRTFSENFEFVFPGKSYTKRQAKWVFEMSAKQSHLQVAAIVDMCHKTVERICNDQVEVREIDWSKIQKIGIDEFAFRKGHKDFIVILVNLDTHEIIDILEERSKDYLRTYFQGLGDVICKKVTDFCSDMWGPFQDLAKELFKNASIHIDRFHWTVHLNKVLDNFRKQLRRENKDESAYKNLKWKLIKRGENLNEIEEKDLQDVFNLSPELEEIYQMRNTFQAIFDNDFSYDFAVGQIDMWIEHSKCLKNKHLDKFVALLGRHRTNILNYFKGRITSGVVEGKNNLLRTIKRFTFNMSNFMNFKRRVFAFDQ